MSINCKEKNEHPSLMETLKDGTIVVCRADSSTMWLIIARQAENPHRQGANVVGMENPTEEELDRFQTAVL